MHNSIAAAGSDVWLSTTSQGGGFPVSGNALQPAPAGRLDMTEAEQALCFLAGANSVFAGEKLLTTPNPGPDRDRLLFDRLGLTPLPARVEG